LGACGSETPGANSDDRVDVGASTDAGPADAASGADGNDGDDTLDAALVSDGAPRDTASVPAMDAMETTGSTGCDLSGCTYSGASGFIFTYSCGTDSSTSSLKNEYDAQGRHVAEILDLMFTNGHSVHCELRGAPGTDPVRLCRDDSGSTCTWD